MELWILAAVGALLLVGALVAVHRARRPRSPLQPEPSPALANSADDLVLVPVPGEQNAVLAIGSSSVIGELDRAGLGKDASDYRQPLLPQVVRRVMGVRTSRQETAERENDVLGTELAEGRIVRLSDQTMQHLAEGDPVVSTSGELLAQVRGDGGRLRHVMRFSKEGPEAIVAANAATLAVTAAVSQRLEAIEERLEEISTTLETLVADADRGRLATVLTGAEILFRVGKRVRENGTMDEDDYSRVVQAEFQVRRQLKEADLKLGESVDRIPPDLNRKERLDALEDLIGAERLEYWLAIVVKAELAQTRWDLLHLYYESSKHPERTAKLTAETRAELLGRRRRLELVGERLKALADPRSRTLLDPVRQLSRHRLAEMGEGVDRLLASHGDVFLPPPPERVDESMVSTEQRRVIDSGFKRLVEPPTGAS